MRKRMREMKTENDEEAAGIGGGGIEEIEGEEGEVPLCVKSQLVLVALMLMAG